MPYDKVGDISLMNPPVSEPFCIRKVLRSADWLGRIWRKAAMPEGFVEARLSAAALLEDSSFGIWTVKIPGMST